MEETWVNTLAEYASKVQNKMINAIAYETERGGIINNAIGNGQSIISTDPEAQLAEILSEEEMTELKKKHDLWSRVVKPTDALKILNNSAATFQSLKNSFIKYMAREYKDSWGDISPSEQQTKIFVEWEQYKDIFTKIVSFIMDKESKDTDIKLVYTTSRTGQNYYRLKPSDAKEWTKEVYDEIDNSIVVQHTEDLKNYPATQDFNEYEKAMTDLRKIYPFTEDDSLFIQHWLVQTKRAIEGMTREYPIMLCFYSPEQGTGKSWLAYFICDVINGRRKVLTFEALTARFKPLEIASEAVIVVDEIGKIDRQKSDDIKSLITAEGAISIERKHRDIRDYKPKANYILTSNKDPSELFYFDSENRRLGIINFPKFQQEASEEEIKSIIKRLWDNTPTKYHFSPKEIEKMAKSYVQNDDMFEYFYIAWRRLEDVEAFDFEKAPGYTAKAWKDIIDRYAETDVSKSKLVNYMQTKHDLFSMTKYEKNTYYRATKTLVKKMQELKDFTNNETIPTRNPHSPWNSMDPKVMQESLSDRPDIIK